MTILEAVGLTRHFGGLAAVRDVSLRLETGCLHALIGPNGAGKSTLINLLSGEVTPDGGRTCVDSQDITGLPPWMIAQAGVGRSYQRTNIMGTLAVLENLRLGAQAKRSSARRLLVSASREPSLIQAAHSALDRVGFTGNRDAVASALSHAEVRLVEIALALTTGDKILLLDEPLAGMGPEESPRLIALLRDLAQDHAVLLVEHDMDVVFAVADVMTVLADGRVLEHGSPAQIRNSPQVRDAYLGHDT